MLVHSGAEVVVSELNFFKTFSLHLNLLKFFFPQNFQQIASEFSGGACVAFHV